MAFPDTIRGSAPRYRAPDPAPGMCARAAGIALAAVSRRPRQHAAVPMARGERRLQGNATMTTRMATAGVFVALLCAGSALAQAVDREPGSARRALYEYRSTTQHALIACGSHFSPRQAAARAADALRAYRGCVARARSEIAVKLDAAVRSVEGTPPCVSALRSYNVAFEQALTGIEPRPAESPLAYEQRQVFLFHGMAHAWGRFEIAESFAY
jgi:hypothetical protein